MEEVPQNRSSTSELCLRNRSTASTSKTSTTSLLINKQTNKQTTTKKNKKKGVRQGVVRCIVGHDEQTQHGPEVDQHHQTAVRKSRQCSTCTRRSGLLVPPGPALSHQPCLHIMPDALGEHHGTVSIGGRVITNLWFAVDIDGLAGEE